MDRIKKILMNELDQLKNKFNIGHELKIIYKPNINRKNENNNNKIPAELMGINILIYEPELDKALECLFHEFHEYFLTKHTDNFYDIINHQKKIINQKNITISEQNELISKLLYRSKEKYIEKLVSGYNHRQK